MSAPKTIYVSLSEDGSYGVLIADGLRDDLDGLRWTRYVLAAASEEAAAEAWRDGYDTAARMVEVTASMLEERGAAKSARIALRGMATSIARSRDDAEANAQARRVESALREQQDGGEG